MWRNRGQRGRRNEDGENEPEVIVREIYDIVSKVSMLPANLVQWDINLHYHFLDD